MRRRLALLLIVLLPTSALFGVAACGDAATEPSRLPVTNDKEGGKGKTDSKVVDPPEETDSGTELPEASTGPGRVYAHTKDTLYIYEPVAGSLMPIAPFTFDDPLDKADIIDLAVDRTGNVFGTTFNDFFSIDPATALCTHIALAGTLDYPNALSFVPAGTADPGKETLVGYASSIGTNTAVAYVKIDTTTGAMTTIGNMNKLTTGPQYRSSGDLVSIIQDGNKTYATVKLMVDGGIGGSDLLAEVDPKDGHVIRIIGDTKQTNLFGFGYWAGKGYGFSDTGRIVEIDMSTGSSVVLKTLMGDGGVALPWYGAGVTTQAPAR